VLAICDDPCVPVGSIPSPSFNGIHVGPFDIHMYGLSYMLGWNSALAATWLAGSQRTATASH
jgi:prolipoprotein diacylglyceryltransferase